MVFVELDGEVLGIVLRIGQLILACAKLTSANLSKLQVWSSPG